MEGGQTAALNALQIRWLGHVAARVVALERPAGEFIGGFEGKQTAALNALKNRWLEHVAARVVALERPEKELLGGLKAGKQQP